MCVRTVHISLFIYSIYYFGDLSMQFLEGQRNTEGKCGQEVVNDRKENINLPFTAAWGWYVKWSNWGVMSIPSNPSLAT